MGSTPYWYTVPYEENIDKALDKLRQREFLAGRYNPAMPFPDFPVTDLSPAPGPRHRSIGDALEASGADGTRSILDISEITEEPNMCAACPLENDVLEELFGTTRPTLEMVDKVLEFTENLGRGEAIYVIFYDADRPAHIFFMGYSFD